MPSVPAPNGVCIGAFDRKEACSLLCAAQVAISIIHKQQPAAARASPYLEDEHGIYRQSDSGHVPSGGILNRLSLSAEEMDRHAAAFDVDLDALAAEYIRSRAARTHEQIAEERAEARAAHGP